MSKSKLIQYLPLSHPKATMRMVRKLANNGIKAILDLEDSVQDPFDSKITKELKLAARKNFLDLISNEAFNEKVFHEEIFLRINSIDSEYFDADIETVLEICKTKFPLAGIFLPMVEEYSQIVRLHDILGSTNLQIQIVPMIETSLGMKNLSDILEQDQKNTIFKHVHFGLFDYALDSNLWPFPDPDHKKFWDIVLNISKLVIDYKKIYIHTPFPFMTDSDLFWRATHHLEDTFPNHEVWSCTLNSELSLSNDHEISELDISDKEFSSKDLIDHAELIKNDFLNGRANKRSFSVGSSRFIPPHQYFSALNYLKKNVKH